MTKLMDKTGLRKLYAMGALAKAPTICDYDIGGAPQIPVEVTITDSQRNGKGAFWMCDIDEIIHEAEANGDTTKKNPNFPILKAIFREMLYVRERLGHPPYESPKHLLPEKIIPDHIAGLLNLDQN